MKIEEWLAAVKAGAYIDYDGIGYLATEKEESNREVLPSNTGKRAFKVPKWATHVCWYNK
jgi:hypothetical protein